MKYIQSYLKSEGTLNKYDAKEIARICKRNGIRLIPLFQCLGHQGWGGGRNSILKHYPQFDETPHIPTDANWPDFFAPSWCPNHPEVNHLAFELIDELIEAFACDGFHVGRDEVIELADNTNAHAVTAMIVHAVTAMIVQTYLPKL